MAEREKQQNDSLLQLRIENLQLTLRTIRTLKLQGLLNIGQLAGKTDSDLADIGLEQQGVIEVREVLASRGL